MSKLFLHVNHLTAFTSFHTVSHYLPLSEFCGQISENITKSPNARKIFLLGLLFVFRGFFVFVFWLIETTAANFQGLAHSNSAKCTNQITRSKENMNYLFLGVR